MNFKELRKKLNEAEDLNKDVNPPSMLVLKRRGVTVFPGGLKVALYVDDYFNLKFTVPFGKGSNKGVPLSGIQTESTINEYVNVIPEVGTALANLIKSLSKKKEKELKTKSKKAKKK